MALYSTRGTYSAIGTTGTTTPTSVPGASAHEVVDEIAVTSVTVFSYAIHVPSYRASYGAVTVQQPAWIMSSHCPDRPYPLPSSEQVAFIAVISLTDHSAAPVSSSTDLGIQVSFRRPTGGRSRRRGGSAPKKKPSEVGAKSTVIRKKDVHCMAI